MSMDMGQFYNNDTAQQTGKYFLLLASDIKQ